MDRLTREHRSWNMSRIRGRDTKPELAVRSALHGLGFRFRVNKRELPGCPDIVLTRHRVVVLVHGCFWHRHRSCRFAYIPRSRVSFWSKKFEKNVERDSLKAKELRRLGWRVIVVWECQTADHAALIKRLSLVLKGGAVRTIKTATV